MGKCSLIAVLVFFTTGLDAEQQVTKGVVFICNQFIHGGAMYAYRGKDRNWEGAYTCSDFERDKYVYRIPLPEIIDILKMAGNDYPEESPYTHNSTDRSYITRDH